MVTVYKISGMTCGGCASTVEKAIKSVSGVSQATVDLVTASVEVNAQREVKPEEILKALTNYPSYQLVGNNAETKNNFWQNKKIWQRASLNTLNCLIGCSLGDFAMIIFLQYFFPTTSMTVQMILATVAGLATSVALESVLLKLHEGFHWKLAFQTALSMSFISMVAMELAMNSTDFMITGGKAAFGNPLYWIALLVSLVAGFFAPLPYNYYKLKKFNKACH